MKTSPRRAPFASAKRGLLAGAAAASLCAGAAAAQVAVEPPGAAESAPGRDGLVPGAMYVEADSLVRDDKRQVTTATGDVEARYDERTLRADALSYDETRGVVEAQNVQIINPDGSVEFAREITFDDDMSAGIAQGFSARLPQNVKLAAASAVRRNPQVNELNRAIYTPCDVCADSAEKGGDGPTWSIQADKVVQDRDRQLIYYRHAVFRLFGAPVLYMPLFWHPDPQAERASGFLPPDISISDRRGVSYEQPYLFVLSPYSDLTLSPQINAKVPPFLNARYRKRFYSGEIDVRAGYTYAEDFDGEGDSFGEQTSRSYILARGAFQLDENWDWGFTAERSSDDLLFDKYEIGDVYESRGPYLADDRRLISQVYAIRQDEDSYLSVAAFDIQGLRPGDDDRTFPTVAPLVEGRWSPDARFAGGRMRFEVDAVALERDLSPASTAGARIPGLDSRRVVAQANWRTSFVSTAGVRLEPFVNLRADAYHLSDVPSEGYGDKSLTRGMATVGADLSWPFFRRFNDKTVVLEPLLQVAASPRAKQIIVGTDSAGEPVYLDEDSLAFEFDETNLFLADKFPGFDLIEGGLRATAAGRATILWDDGRRASLLIGRSFRDEEITAFPERTGLRDTASDWVVAAEAQPLRGLSFFSRARLDGDSLDVRRAETGANVAMARGSGFFRYLWDDLDINGVKRENLDLGGEVFLTKNWGLSAYGNRDMVQDAWVVRDLGIVYRDECTRIEVIYRREDTVIGRLGPSESVSVRLTLATLGEPIYAN
ncbi:LPS-assembly protein LptD [Phenylobacterium sp.]|uniref:LPS-assembly protein LptD n=1 Tax=Phenylobacterium sp. TaxID=1871053 RepID=UPI001850B829|nr:LPS assembly protein LptD [Phenylobacterium sp.]MBA4792824.1 LPS-assembly protein LptD [Phenylobacterium sp.]